MRRHLAGDVVLAHHHEADAIVPEPIGFLGAVSAHDQLDLRIDPPRLREDAPRRGLLGHRDHRGL